MLGELTFVDKQGSLNKQTHPDVNFEQAADIRANIL